MQQDPTTFKKSSYLVFSFAYGFFILYGSLVPLEYSDLAFEEALYRFEHIQYLNLGTGSRADWVANIVLYIPLSFSLAGYCLYRVQSYFKILVITTVILIASMALAISLEFIQLYFPPRTVSQNDLIAETIGSILGLVLWIGFGNKLQKLIHFVVRGGRSGFIAMGVLYALVYLLLSFFPYDFVTSFSELEEKFVNGKDTFFISSSCGGFIFCSLKFAIEIILVVPLALLMIVLFSVHPHRQTLIILIGMALGVVIEGIQIFIISGIAQGFSIFSRILGMVTGLVLYEKRSLLRDYFKDLNFKKYLIIVFFPYVLLLAKLNGWSISVPVLNTSVADRFEQIKWLPFYYHYFTSEAVALVSLLYNLIIYLPVGLGVWLWNIDNPNHILNLFSDKFKAGLYAFGLCLLMESGKLFFSLKHPDPTNLIISFVSAYICCFLAEIMYLRYLELNTSIKNKSHDGLSSISTNQVKTSVDNIILANIKQSENRESLATEGNPLYQMNQENYSNQPTRRAKTLNDGSVGSGYQADSNQRQFPQQTSSFFAKTIGIILVVIVVWKTLNYSGSPAALAVMLILYGLMLAKYPQTWLIVLPAFLPVLDFAPWTGQFFFSEFDIFILFTLAINTGYGRILNPFKSFKAIATILCLLFIISYIVSLFNGILPLQSIDQNAFSNYYSHYNSLRVGKGVIWAFLLLPSLTFYHHHSASQTKIFFSYGLLIGLVGIGLNSLWERIIFTGLFNYTNDYRITSMFSSMHTGGGHIDAYLVTVIPFIAVLFRHSKYNFIRNLSGIGLFILSLYVLMVTFSRGPYISLIIQLVVFGLCLLLIYQKQLLSNWKKVILIPLFLLMIPLIVIPVFKGGYIQQRFSEINKDIDIRMAHWTDAIQMMPSDFYTTLTGMGLGAYPRTYFLGNSEGTIPATYAFLKENETSFLRLWGGDSLYMEQIVDTTAYSKYILAIDFRSNLTNPSITIPICEKALLYAFNCKWQTLQKKSDKDKWVHVERIIDMKSTGAAIGKLIGDLTKRPIKLSIYNGNKNAVVDIKNINLLEYSSNNDLLENGDFSKGLENWFFSTDNHLPWHIKNIWVQLLFDQGWLGLLIFTGLLLYAFVHQIKLLLQKDLYAPVLLTSLTGFMIVGAVASPFDAPRLTLLFFLVLFMAFFDQSKNQSYNEASYR